MSVGKVEGYQEHLSRSKGRRDCEFEFENEPCYFYFISLTPLFAKIKTDRATEKFHFFKTF